MKKEIVYRLTRIVMIICFVIISSFLRDNVVESYNGVDLITDSLTNNLKVEVIEDKSLSNDGYMFRITNYGVRDKSFTIALETDSYNTISNNNVIYTVIKDNDLVVTDNLSENGYLSKETLSVNETSVYEIKFWLDEGTKDGVFSSKIVLI